MQKAFGNIDLHFGIKESSIDFYVQKCALKCHILVYLFSSKITYYVHLIMFPMRIPFRQCFFFSKVMQQVSIYK